MGLVLPRPGMWAFCYLIDLFGAGPPPHGQLTPGSALRKERDMERLFAVRFSPPSARGFSLFAIHSRESVGSVHPWESVILTFEERRGMKRPQGGRSLEFKITGATVNSKSRSNNIQAGDPLKIVRIVGRQVKDVIRNGNGGDLNVMHLQTGRFVFRKKSK